MFGLQAYGLLRNTLCKRWIWISGKWKRQICLELPRPRRTNCKKCVEKGNYFNIEELSRNSQKLNCMSWKQIAAQILDRRVIGVHFVCPFITFRCADPFYEGSYTAGSLQCGFPGKRIF